MEYKHYKGIFSTTGDVQTAIQNGDLYKPYVAIVGGQVDFNSIDGGVDYKSMPLTFEILSDGVIKWKLENGYSTNRKKIDYSKNNGAWTQINSSTAGTSISVNTGDIIQFRGANSNYGISYNIYNCFNTTVNFKIYGNIMSLINKTNWTELTALTSDYAFSWLFQSCTGLTDASNLMLPVTTLAANCYYNMFNGCISLVSAPELPATTLAGACYSNMFNGCTSLTSVPSNYLPATTLTYSCYSSMFNNCSSLVSAPELPATTLAANCYYNMFNGCISLVSAPELPATTLAEYCYYNMFNGCSSLNYIKCLATTGFDSNNCIQNWVNNVASTGTFVKASGVSWPSGTSGIPNNWTVIEE